MIDMTTHILLAACLLATAIAAPHAQQAPASDRPKFGTSTAAVVVDVIVRDKKGNAVVDLTKDDFEVFENGSVQKVIDFERVRPGSAAPPVAGSDGDTGTACGRRVSRRRALAPGAGRDGHRLRLAHRPVALRGVEGGEHAARSDGAKRLRRRLRDRPGAAAHRALHARYRLTERRVRLRRHASEPGGASTAKRPTGCPGEAERTCRTRQARSSPLAPTPCPPASRQVGGLRPPWPPCSSAR